MSQSLFVLSAAVAAFVAIEKEAAGFRASTWTKVRTLAAGFAPLTEAQRKELSGELAKSYAKAGFYSEASAKVAAPQHAKVAFMVSNKARGVDPAACTSMADYMAKASEPKAKAADGAAKAEGDKAEGDKAEGAKGKNASAVLAGLPAEVGNAFARLVLLASKDAAVAEAVCVLANHGEHIVAAAEWLIAERTALKGAALAEAMGAALVKAKPAKATKAKPAKATVAAA